MINPSKERHSYSDLLKPPSGYKVEFAVGTTYSLDLEALIGVPIALCLSEEMEDTFIQNPIAAIEGIRRASNSFMVFCEGGQIKVPENLNHIYSLMEDSVYEVALPNNKSFHPKVWVVKYTSEKEDLYRLIVLSRNLTFDRSWDMVVAIEGRAYSKKNKQNKPLKDFMEFLIQYTDNEDKKEKLKELISEVEHVQFETNNKYYTDFKFHPIGIKNYNKNSTEIFNTYHNLMIISPFLSKSIVNELNNLALSYAPKTLITRKSEITKLDSNILKEMDVYALKDIIVDGEESLGEDGDGEYKKQDIHTKFYARTKYSEHNFYIGSANCSNNAFNGNVEFMINLTYKKRGFRIDDLLDDLFGKEDKENPFEQITEMIPQSEEKYDIPNELEKVIKQLCRGKIKATVVECEDDYKVIVKTDVLRDDVNYYISPLGRNIYVPMNYTTIIDKLNLIDLGNFYKVKVEKDGEKVDRVIKIYTDNIPDDRNSEIFKSIINNEFTFLKYISFILSDDFLIETLKQIETENKNNNAWERCAMDGPILYENMLKSVSRQPEKIEDINKIIDMIDDNSIVSSEFLDFYNIVLGASRKVKR